ncbi:MAG: hypothetical protein HeimC3_09920 [Candidatus Heimdallarchaeota archaeon LC_3]|nr:MAG: hypothetical protein HeimC3_09920 [Candidatus Heimdallarchaeota archaeon LC_3]
MYEYWFMFFIAIIIATTAMTLGVGGALFFSPIFILLFPILGVTVLSPADAFGAALITEVFGFASGLIGYGRKKLIDYKTATSLLIFTVPLAIVGTIIKRQINETGILNLIFGVGLLLLALYIIKNISQKEPPIPSSNSPKRLLIDSDMNEYEYLVCNQNQGRILSGIGGFVTGLISVGVGETVVSTLRIRCGLPMRVATGTSVLVVTITVLSAALTDIATIGVESVPYDLILFTIPGVLIGGQIGAKVASRVDSHTAERLLILIFVIFGGVMAVKALLDLFF